MDVATGVERAAHRTDAAVHHVGGGDHVGAGAGVGDGLTLQHRHGLVVHHVAGVVDQAVLAVAGVRVERDVGDDAQVGQCLLECGHHTRHQAVRVVGLARVERLERRVDNREQRKCGDAEVARLLGGLEQQIERLALDPRHRGHRFFAPGAVEHKHRQDEVGRAQRRLAHHAARPVVVAHTAQAGGGELAARLAHGGLRQESAV